MCLGLVIFKTASLDLVFHVPVRKKMSQNTFTVGIPFLVLLIIVNTDPLVCCTTETPKNDAVTSSLNNSLLSKTHKCHLFLNNK